MSCPEDRSVPRSSPPIPVAYRPNKKGRDTAEGCRDRANADMLQALSMTTANGREALERSAASWTTRAMMLDRLEDGMEARQVAPRLTLIEMAEDAACLAIESASRAKS